MSVPRARCGECSWIQQELEHVWFFGDQCPKCGQRAVFVPRCNELVIPQWWAVYFTWTVGLACGLIGFVFGMMVPR